MTSYSSVTDSSLRQILETVRAHELSVSGFEQLFLACAAKITFDNWGKDGATFFIIMSEDQMPLYMDNFYVLDFLPGHNVPVENFAELLEIILSNPSMLSLEFSYKDEDEVDEYVYEAFFFIDEETRAALDSTAAKVALIKSLPAVEQAESPLWQRMHAFICEVLT